MKFLSTMKNTSPRLMRWAMALQPYNYTVQHLPGHLNVEADALSRTWDHQLPTSGPFRGGEMLSSTLLYSFSYLLRLKLTSLDITLHQSHYYRSHDSLHHIHHCHMIYYITSITVTYFVRFRFSKKSFCTLLCEISTTSLS